MAKFIDVEVWVLVDGAGNWVVGADGDAVNARYAEDVGDEDHAEPRRLIKVRLKVPVPQVVELAAQIGEEAAAGELRVA